MMVKDIVRVNCRTGYITREPEGRRFKMMGGRLLTSTILLETVNPCADPLGPENKIILAGMLVSGCNLTTVNRLSVGTKSPLTGTIKESNVGGTAGMFMSEHAIKAIILEDAPNSDACRILHIRSDGTIALEDASYLRGFGTYETGEILRQKYHSKRLSIMAIGQAGERRYKISSIMVSEFKTEIPCRAAGRGGTGAVLGSKGIKAVVFEKADNPYRPQPSDKDVYNEAVKKISRAVLAKSGVMRDMGTLVSFAATVPMHIAPYKNFSGEDAPQELRDKFTTQNLVERVKSYGGRNGHPCQPGCLVQCSNVYHDKNGEYVTAALEYEIVELCLFNSLIEDLDIVAHIDRFCDDFGVDNIEVGCMLGIYMESGRLAWGDGEGALKLLKSFYEKESEDARAFGGGTERLGRELGVKRIPACKGQSFAAYDPRALKGLGVTYATSPMGADHTCGSSMGVPGLNPTEKEGQVEFSYNKQFSNAITDCNACSFAWGSIASEMDSYVKAVSLLTEEEWTGDMILDMGRQTVLNEREFNRRAGFTAEDDKMPEAFCIEVAQSVNTAFDIPHGKIVEHFWNKKP